jgi:hypothetical protein
MITALAVMIAIAGYLQFSGTNLDEKYLKTEDTVDAVDSSNVAMGDTFTEIESLDSDVDVAMEDSYEDSFAEATPEEDEIPGEAVFTSTQGVAMLSEARILKEQTRAKNKDTLMSIINSEGLTDAQKQEAVDCMVKMTEIAEKEAAAQILLEAKGFRDTIVSINDGAVDVVVNAAELSDIQRAQIEDIVKRKTDISAENVIISTIQQ